MNVASLIPDPQILRLECIVTGTEFVTLKVKTVQPLATCPTCGQASRRVHSRYERSIADLPWSGIAVRLRLRSRKFFCTNENCTRAIFTERLPRVVSRYARRSVRLNEALRLIGYIAGGEAGAQLAVALGYQVSPDTLLQRVRQAPTVEHPTPRVLGVDDWAKRRGHTYGTVLVDLERHCVLDLLPDREAETLAAWLGAHPGVEIISRDRSGAYADGARQGAPDAVQVADRFHLMKNMTEAVERFLNREQRFLRPAAEAVSAEPAAALVVPAEEKPVADQVTLTRAETSRERRLARYLEVRAMHRQGATIKGIADHFRMHRRSVRLFVRSDTFPERVRPQMRRRSIDRFVPYLKQRWDDGCHNAAELWREIRAQGFRGGSSAVRQYIACWRALLPSPLRRRRRNEAQNYPVPLVVPSPRRATWLLLRETKELEEEQREFVERFFDLCPAAQTVQTLARGFNEIVRGRQVGQLESWLAAASTSQIPEMKSFVMGVERDKEAVAAALTYEWSQGQVEGQINRLKMIKRGMFGRAKLDLLKARVLKAA